MNNNNGQFIQSVFLVTEATLCMKHGGDMLHVQLLKGLRTLQLFRMNVMQYHVRISIAHACMMTRVVCSRLVEGWPRK